MGEFEKNIPKKFFGPLGSVYGHQTFTSPPNQRKLKLDFRTIFLIDFPIKLPHEFGENIE